MLTIDSFNKNNSYTDEEINELVQNVDKWTDENYLYVYTTKNDVTDRQNLMMNIVRIHRHINKDRLVKLLLNFGGLNEVQSR